MSSYKSRQVFDQEVQRAAAEEELTAQQQFAPDNQFVPSVSCGDEEQTDAEQEMDAVIRPSGKRRWLAGGLLTAFTGLVGWQAADTVLTAVQSGDWLTVGWAGFSATLAGLGISALARELWRLKQLRRHFTVQQQSEAMLHSDSIGKGAEFCQLLAEQGNITPEDPHLDRWRNSINVSHNDAEVLEMYDAMVICQQDKRAKALVAKIASEAALLVAVSPLAVADILLVAWRSFRLIDQLGAIYGVELGYWSRIRLFKLVLANMAAAGATELVADASIDLLSMDLAGKVSTRVAQGFGVGILTARLGIKAMALLRPVPWQQDNQVRLGEIRKELIIKLKSKI